MLPKFNSNQLGVLSIIWSVSSVVLSIGVGTLTSSPAAGCITFAACGFTLGGFLGYQFVR